MCPAPFLLKLCSIVEKNIPQIEVSFYIIIMIYLYGYSAVKIVRAKKITRQTANQIKLRTLHKLKTYIYIFSESLSF